MTGYGSDSRLLPVELGYPDFLLQRGTIACFSASPAKFFDQLPGTNSGQGSGYDPLSAFGTGLSYTSFQTSGLRTSGTVSTRGTVTVSFTVVNSGDRAGTEVVPVYVRQPVSDVLAPGRRLVGFARVTLDPAQSQSVEVSFPADKLAVTPADINGDGRPAVEPGAYQAVVGNLTAGFTLR